MKKTMKQILSVALCGLLMLSAFAVMGIQAVKAENFTPSAEEKEITVVPVEGKEDDVVAEIVKKDDKNPEGEVTGDVQETYVVLTPFSEVQEAEKEVKERLEDAKKDIESVEALGELNEELEQIAKDLYGEEYNSTIFQVSTIFDLDLLSTYASKEELLSDDTLFFRIAIKPEGSTDEKPVILCKVNDTWEIISLDNINFDSNNNLVIDFDKLGTVAVLHADLSKNNKDYTPPKTGCGCDFDYWWIILIIALIIIAAVVFAIIRIRLSKNKKDDTKKAEDQK